MTMPAYSKPSSPGIWTSASVFPHSTATPHASPEATAFAFGAMLQREYGNDWPRLIGIATQAAMQADHEVME